MRVCERVCVAIWTHSSNALVAAVSRYYFHRCHLNASQQTIGLNRIILCRHTEVFISIRLIRYTERRQRAQLHTCAHCDTHTPTHTVTHTYTHCDTYTSTHTYILRFCCSFCRYRERGGIV